MNSVANDPYDARLEKEFYKHMLRFAKGINAKEFDYKKGGCRMSNFRREIEVTIKVKEK